MGVELHFRPTLNIDNVDLSPRQSPDPTRVRQGQDSRKNIEDLSRLNDSSGPKTIYLDESQFRKLMGLGDLSDDQILLFANQVAFDLGFESQPRPENPYIESVMKIYNSEFIQSNQFIPGHKIDLDRLFKNILGVFIRHNKYENAELLIKLYKKIHPNDLRQDQKYAIFSEYRKAFYGTEQLLITNLNELNQYDSSNPLIQQYREFFVNLKNQFIKFANLFGGLDELAKFANPKELTLDDKKSIIEQEYELLSIMPDSDRPAFEYFFKQISGIPDQERKQLRSEYDEYKDFLLGIRDSFHRDQKRPDDE